MNITQLLGMQALPLTPKGSSTRSPSTLLSAIGISLLAAVILTALLPVGAHAQGASKKIRTGQILVQPRAGLSDIEFEKIIRRAGGRTKRKLARLQVRVIEVAPQAEEAVARALSRNRKLAFAEVDQLIEPFEIIPNDTHYSNAWHLPKIQAPAAWDIARGDGVTVAILDSGVDAFHPDLQANMVGGRNTVSNNSSTDDVNGHGTKVAGVVAALSNNAQGVASIAWNARIMPIRVSNTSDGWAYFSDIAEGITWAADHGARVANASYDVSGSSTVRNAAQYMKNLGGIVVVSAGNTGADPGHTPSSTLLSVSATGSSDTRPSWSSYGNFVDVSAPGVGVWTTTRGGSYGAPSGTSFSSPATAAVVALIMSANAALSPTEVESVLKNSVDDIGDPGWDVYYGVGRINAAAAVQLAASVAPGDTDPPNVVITNPTMSNEVQEQVAVDVFATDSFGVSRVELYVRGQKVGTDSAPPYQFTWDSTQGADGDAVLLALAFDEAGNEGRSDNVTVAVSNGGASTAPVVKITSPSDGATVSGNVSLAANATSTGSAAISMVSLFVDGKLKCAGSPSTSCSWNSRKASSGAHTVNATAEDAAGNTSSTSVSVTVGGSSSPRGGGGKKGGGKKK